MSSTNQSERRALTLPEFALMIRDSGGYLRVLFERLQGHEMTDEQIAELYEAYLKESR
jgi:hypothetical protein